MGGQESVVRLYMDETGDHTRPKSQDLGQRYLGLTGVAFNEGDYDTFARRLDELKRAHLPYDPDDPPILHRKEIVQCQGPFYVLQDAKRRASFDADLLALIEDTTFVVFSLVLDKLTHGAATYRRLRHPYHFALLGLLERYCGRLAYRGRRGRVIAEARGGVEDRELQNAYDSFRSRGTKYLDAFRAQATLASRTIDIKPKRSNVAGLQLADLLAHPLKREVLRTYGRSTQPVDPFSARLCPLVEPKYNRRIDQDRIDGYGRIILA